MEKNARWQNLSVPAAAHLPRRRKENRRTSEQQNNPNVRRSKSNLRKCCFKSSLPTIDEADIRSEISLPSSYDDNQNSKGKWPPTYVSYPLKIKNIDKQGNQQRIHETSRRAVISIFEKRPTRSTLTLPPPIQSSSFVRIGSEEILIAQRRPFVVYDLLPPKLKSPSFLLRFDLDIPRPRLILTHRTFFKRYEELSLSDRQELVLAALCFLSTMNLPDCSMIIPLGKNNKCDTLFNTFYAYISVPSVFNFIKVYEQLKRNIPLWPSIRWVTSYWDTNFSESSVEKSYLQIVREYHRRWHDTEVPLMEFKDCVPEVSRRMVMDGFIAMPCPNKTDKIIICEKSRRIGLILNDEIYESRPELRWHFLELMFRHVEQYVKNRQNGCYMFLSLAERYLLPQSNKVFAFLQFDDEMPHLEGT